MKRTTFIILCLLGLMVATSGTVWAGACDEGDSIHEQRKIHGPANIRTKPNGKLITSLPMGFEVLALKNLPFKNSKGKESFWFYIQWKKAGLTHHGWTHENNIICD